MEYKHLESHGNRNRDCDCPLSCTSYPHWPPTSLKEAFDQLYLLQDQHNRHRRYLAHQWWAFVRSQASIRPVYERDVDTADILALCPWLNDQRVGDVTIIVGLFWKVGIGMDVFVSVETILMQWWLSYSWCTVNFLGLTGFILRRFPLYKDTLNGYDLVIVYPLFNNPAVQSY